MTSKKHLEKLLGEIGVNINGSNPWDIQVHDQRVFQMMLFEPSLGAGETYMSGLWDCKQLDELFFRIGRHQLENKINNKLTLAITSFLNKMINFQSHRRSLKVAEKHYNLGNKLYRAMLGSTMSYTCAYWKHADKLDDAQLDKFDLICKKLNLKQNERVLDLGCGWGTLTKFIAENYKCKVVAVNISTEQVRYAQENTKGLPVTVCLSDYRDANKYNPEKIPFDKVLSVGLCEHVGRKNYAAFMKVVHENLREDGLFLLHTIGNGASRDVCDPWITKYIFPNSMLPSLKWLTESMENLFIVEDVHNFGADYDKTLMAWHKNFVDNWDSLKSSYDEVFYKMWNYYLLSCAGEFRARSMQLWQLVLSPKGALGGYEAVR